MGEEFALRNGGFYLLPDGSLAMRNNDGSCCGCGCNCACPQPCYQDGGTYDLSCSQGHFKKVGAQTPTVKVLKKARYSRICCGFPLTLAWRTLNSEVWTVDSPTCGVGFVVQSDEILTMGINDNSPSGGLTTMKRVQKTGNTGLCMTETFNTSNTFPGQTNGCLQAIADMFSFQLRTTDVPYEVSFLLNQGTGSPTIVEGWWSQSNYAFSMYYRETWPAGSGSGYPFPLYRTRYLYQYAEPGILSSCGSTCRTACCLPGGFCREDLNLEECRALGGRLSSPGTSCYAAGCGPEAGARKKGACCDPLTGNCTQTTAELCIFPKVFKGVGVPCAANTCPPVVGACCLNGGSLCQIKTLAECNLALGTWQGANTNCTTNPCNQGGGACCLPDGSCTQVNSAQACQALGGMFQGVSSDCQIVNCGGACCFRGQHGRMCAEMSFNSCMGFPDPQWLGYGTSCVGVNCEIPPGIIAPPPPSSKIVIPGGVSVTGGCSSCGGAGL